MGYLDNTGLAYFWEKIKSNFFSGTKEIPANADLDDYKTPGVYNCPQNTTVETLSNAPAPYAFSMRVYIYLPAAVASMIGAGRASVGILESRDSWLGVTYREDKPRVQTGIAALVDSGVYPSPLFRD